MNAISRSLYAWICVALFALVAFPSSASAQWTRVSSVAGTDIFSVWANGDTLAAAADTAVYVSTDAGATWKRSARVAAGATRISAALVRNGRLYAGAYGQGVFVSDDLGTTWLDFNQGLVGGIGNDQLDIWDLVANGDSLYAATVGDGPWVRNLTSGTWSHFGRTLQDFSAGNMTAITAGGSRLFAAGGFNGTVFYRDPGQADWTVSLLFNDRFAPGLAGLAATYTGRRWVVGTNIGLYHSATGQEPWTYVDFGRSAAFVGFATLGPTVFASLGNGSGTLIVMSHDDGVTWQALDTMASVFVYKLARHDTTLYAGRVDGLWRRSIANVSSVPDGVPSSRLSFAIAGSHPVVGDGVRFAFDLPEAGPIAIDVFDIAGHRVGERIRETRPAGHGEATWDAGRLSAGVYFARLTASGRHATARLVHMR